MTEGSVDMPSMDVTKKPIVLRRNHKGLKAEEFCQWPEQSFEDMDSTVAVQQYIQQLIRRDPSAINEILNLPEQQDEGVWKYEHLRQFCMELNKLAVRLQRECTPATCSQMTGLCTQFKNLFSRPISSNFFFSRLLQLLNNGYFCAQLTKRQWNVLQSTILAILWMVRLVF